MHPLLLIYTFAALFSLSVLSSANAKSLRGFSTDLIHPDSPLSPFDDENNNSLVNQDSRTFVTDLTAATFTYLMSIKVTTHDTIETRAIPDTGSNFIWLNSEGCTGTACLDHKAKFVAPPDNLQTLKCSSPECGKFQKELPRNDPKCSGGSICGYDITYKDKFNTRGKFSIGSLSFTTRGGELKQAKNIWFGVSEYSNGNMDKNSAGIIGLGRGELSLISQLVKNVPMKFRFAYCLPSPDQHSNSPSKLVLGNQVQLSKLQGKSTPLIQESCLGDLYCIYLESVFVDGDITPIKVGKIMYIDSGSTITYLTKEVFSEFIIRVKDVVGHVGQPSGYYHHCFKPEDVAKLKKVSFLFSGTTLELKQENFFDKRVDGGVSYLCLTVADGGETNILGSRAQVDFEVAFDITEKKVSFEEVVGCSK